MRTFRIQICLYVGFLLLGLAVSRNQGQQRGASSRGDLLDVLPSAVTAHAKALGERVLSPGKERTVLTGLLVTDSGASDTLRVTTQLPVMVRIDGLKGNGRPLIFDGTGSAVPNSRIEEQLLEIFTSDTAEAMLVSVRNGGAVQLLGRHVRMDEGQDPSEVVLYDVFEWAGRVESSPAAPERLKRYLYDSRTGLLARTQYLDESFSPPARVEIRLSDWRDVDGSFYPGHIERLENGHKTFSWTVTKILVSPHQDVKTFVESPEPGK